MSHFARYVVKEKPYRGDNIFVHISVVAEHVMAAPQYVHEAKELLTEYESR